MTLSSWTCLGSGPQFPLERSYRTLERYYQIPVLPGPCVELPDLLGGPEGLPEIRENLTGGSRVERGLGGPTDKACGTSWKVLVGFLGGLGGPLGLALGRVATSGIRAS